MEGTHLGPVFSAAGVASWSDPGQAVALSFDDAIRAFHAFGPRARFIKTLPFGAKMLDAGAGDGGTMALRDWPEPARPDIAMYAWAGDASPGFGRYAGSEVGWWPDNPPRFGGQKFDAVFSCNFIEHIENPMAFIAQAIGMLTPAGRIYLEWPRRESVQLPTTAELAALDVRVTTGAYHDDSTHRDTMPELADVLRVLEESGLRVAERGIAQVPFVDRQVAIHARQKSDLIAMTLAYWSYTGWCQFVTAERR